MTAEARASSAPGECGCCEELARRISDYHDGRWRAGEGAEVEEHLAVCPRCAELLEDYRALSGAARLAPECECTPARLERISRGVRARIRRQVFRRRLGWTGLSVGVAAAAAVIIAVMLAPVPARDRRDHDRRLPRCGL